MPDCDPKPQPEKENPPVFTEIPPEYLVSLRADMKYRERLRDAFYAEFVRDFPEK